MRKKWKKIASLALASSLVFMELGGTAQAASADTQSIALYYTKGAPSSSVRTSQKFSVNANGTDYLYVHCTRINSVTSGAYMSVEPNGTTYEFNVKNIDEVGTNKLIYSGDYVPKKGVAVPIKVSLKNYSSKSSALIYGNVSRYN